MKSNKRNTLEPLISVVQNSETSPSSTIINKHLTSYNASVTGLSASKENFNKIVETINKHFPLIKEDYIITKFNESIFVRAHDSSFIIVGNISMNTKGYDFDMFTNSFEQNHLLYNLIKEYLEISTDTEIIFITATSTPQGINYNNKILSLDDFTNLSNEYYPYMDTDEMFTQFQKYNENILCLLGKAGTGKSKMSTSYMKFLLENENLLQDNEYDYSVLYVKSEEVLTDDTFWSNLNNTSYDLIILDDLDYLFGSRGNVSTELDAKKNKFISNLLSFTDGVQYTNTKIIITTNRQIHEVDDAILRKGRMFDILELRPLTNDEALKIWTNNKLDENKFHKLFKGDVLQANLGSEISKCIKDDSTERRSYLQEENISLINSYLGNKTVGFM